MIWDTDIPIPTKQVKWDFSGADVGYSLPFHTRKEAEKFANILRNYARMEGKAWGALIASQTEESLWRVWIVERRIRARKNQRGCEVPALPVIATTTSPALPASVEIDDDIMLSVDSRRGGLINIGKQPEPQPTEEQTELTATGRRRKQRKTAE